MTALVNFVVRGGVNEVVVPYPDGTSITERRTWFGFVRRIEVTSPDGQSVSFARTNRQSHQLTTQLLYPSNLVVASVLKGKKVLDAGCGGAAYVAELRSKGVDAVGADAYLTSSQRRLPWLYQAMSTELPFSDNEFDVVFSTWSSISYEGHSKNPEVQNRNVKLLRELARVVKPGGKIRLSPVPFEVVTDADGASSVAFPQMNKLLEQIPELAINQAADIHWYSRTYYTETPDPTQMGAPMNASVWMELVKR